MGRWKKLFATGCAVAGVSFGASASAQQLSMATYEAEQLRSLDIMLMVMELHCRNTEHGLADAYDAFATRHRQTMNAASARLRSSYAGGQGERAQRRALDLSLIHI